MDDRYSVYDAKAKLSEIVRRVREGQTITLTYRGEPVAEVRPVPRGGGTPEHIRRLEERGVIVPARRPGAAIPPLARKRGAVARFLKDRNRL
ncbi:MAG: hypothetical protein A2085_02550 [Gemmatimonadetes bacterium GWC2_71_10]|nr:MAG: hypothetical protein A2085_02550 [Gemmatimonadetes bacterium GWC2_71_10]